jgi:2-succinyl-6-hydroxy-2,4-cyclohexadiene-1-carboxylate synthase
MTQLVLLHGFMGTPQSFAAVLAALPPTVAERARVAPLLGHGSNGAVPVGGENSEVFLRAVDELAAWVATEPLRPGEGRHLCGYSLGARLGLTLLLRHPELFGSASLIGAHPGLESEAARLERRAQDAALCVMLEEQGLEAFVNHWERLPLFESQRTLPPELRLAQRRERLSHSVPGLVAAMRGLGLAEMPNTRPALPTLTARLQLLVGGRDRKFLSLARQLAALVPRARLYEVQEAGHNLLLEAPLAVARVMTELIVP